MGRSDMNTAPFSIFLDATSARPRDSTRRHSTGGGEAPASVPLRCTNAVASAAAVSTTASALSAGTLSSPSRVRFGGIFATPIQRREWSRRRTGAVRCECFLECATCSMWIGAHVVLGDDGANHARVSGCIKARLASHVPAESLHRPPVQLVRLERVHPRVRLALRLLLHLPRVLAHVLLLLLPPLDVRRDVARVLV